MSTIKIKQNDTFVDIPTLEGAQGPQGIQGPAGEGIPTGGNENNILVKQSSADYDTIWASLVDLIYPVGAYIETSDSSFDPNTTWGGTWELIDKEFKSEASSSDVLFTANSTNCELRSCYYTRSGHSIQIRLNFTNKVALTESAVDLGNFNYDELGITTMPFSLYYALGTTDDGNGIFLFRVDSKSGNIESREVLSKNDNSIAVDSSCYLLFDVVVTASRMIDSFCDKFYWKRTA